MGGTTRPARRCRATRSRRCSARGRSSRALAMLRQIEFALFDFRLHHEYTPERGSRVQEILGRSAPRGGRHRAAARYNRFAHAFGHVFGGGYAAGYYSYKWAEVLAADAFAAFEEHGRVRSRDGRALPARGARHGRQPQGARRVRRLPRPRSRSSTRCCARPASRRSSRLTHASAASRPLKVATWNVNSLRVRSTARAEVARARAARRARPPGDQAQGRRLPADTFRDYGYFATVQRPVGLQRRGDPVARSADIDQLWHRQPLRRRAKTRARRHLRPVAVLEPVRAERPERRVGQVSLQARVARGAAAVPRGGAGGAPRAACSSATSISRPTTATCTIPRSGKTKCCARRRNERRSERSTSSA